MRRYASAALALGLAVFLASDAAAQQSTEQFIPIGKSPGISGKYSYFGSIQSVDAAARTVTVQAEDGSWTVKITDKTRIWIDRSASQQANTTGSFADLRPGVRIEMKYVDYEKKEEAEWVKVAAGSG